MKLQKKLLFSYLIVILLPVILISYFLITKTTEETLKQTGSINEISFRQMRNNISNLFGSYIQISDSIRSDTPLNDLLEKEYPESDDFGVKYFDYYNIYSMYKNKYALYYINGIKITVYSDNDELVYDNEFFFSLTDEFKNTEWYEKVQKSKGINFIGTPYFSDNKYQIPMGRILNSEASYGYTNLLSIVIPENLIYRLIEKEAANKSIYILSDDNYIISSTDRDKIGQKYEDIYETQTKHPDISSIEQEIIINNGDETIYADKLSDKGSLSHCKVISIVSSRPIIEKNREIIRDSIVICVFSVIIATAFVLIFSRQLSSRLKKLVRNMSKIKDGKFDVFVSYDEKDEIGELSRSFKTMIDRINALITEVYVAELKVKNFELKTKEAQIRALQSQINPHFLFNSMESIRSNLLKKQDFETSDIVESFARLLRKSIDWTNDNIPLQQEIELVEHYLKVQKFRFRQKLVYEINIDQQYYQNLIPKFSLQPLVENAIYHGIEMKRDGGCIQIYSETFESHFKIVVRDNGIGISTENLEIIKEKLTNWKEEKVAGGIGILNVHQRFKMFYGENYGLEYESIQGVGTTVSAIIPSEKREGGIGNV